MRWYGAVIRMLTELAAAHVAHGLSVTFWQVDDPVVMK